MTLPDHDLVVDDFERSLLASAKGDRMPAERKRALVASLAGAASLTAAGTAKAAATTAAAAAKKGGAAVVLAKWIAAGAVGTALAFGASKGALVVYEERASSPPTVAQAPVVTAPAPAPAREDAPAEKSAEPEPAAEEVKPVADSPAAAPRAIAQAGGKSRKQASARPIADEVVVIERARAALARGDAPAADQALAEHARDFPDGVLRDEARVLRIDALARRGDRAGAARAARAWLASHPNSPYAPRVRAHVSDEGGS